MASQIPTLRRELVELPGFGASFYSFSHSAAAGYPSSVMTANRIKSDV